MLNARVIFVLQGKSGGLYSSVRRLKIAPGYREQAQCLTYLEPPKKMKGQKDRPKKQRKELKVRGVRERIRIRIRITVSKNSIDNAVKQK